MGVGRGNFAGLPQFHMGKLDSVLICDHLVHNGTQVICGRAKLDHDTSEMGLQPSVPFSRTRWSCIDDTTLAAAPNSKQGQVHDCMICIRLAARAGQPTYTNPRDFSAAISSFKAETCSQPAVEERLQD